MLVVVKKFLYQPILFQQDGQGQLEPKLWAARADQMLIHTVNRSLTFISRAAMALVMEEIPQNITQLIKQKQIS